MLLYHLRGGRGCQNPSNDICDSPGLASHPGLTVTALLQSTVNRRKKIDSLYCNAIPCHPAPQPMTCGLILHATSVKFSVVCFHIPYLQKENMYMQGGGGGGLTAQGGGGGGGGG